MIDEQKAMREEIAELRGQVIAWQKQCDTLTHQVLCCGVAASHPDATLTTRGAYAGKWNSAQAEEVRKLRAECDKMRSERTAWRVTAENAVKDAARYRWLRDNKTKQWAVCTWMHGDWHWFSRDSDVVDAAIDAAKEST